jgi:catalase
VEAPKPTPASFATESYYAVNAFRFVDRKGTVRSGRYRIRPLEGEKYLSPADAAAQPPDFLFHEIEQRLAKGLATFRLYVQIAAEGDRTDDGSLPWPSDRPQVELGKIEVKALVANSNAEERKLVFDPTRLVDGIELSDDPLPLARSAIYAISYRRRNT